MKKMLMTAAVSLFAFAAVASADLAATSKGATHYRLLSEPTSLREVDIMKKPQAFHVKAVPSGNGLQWVAKVEGRGKLCTDGQDLLSLNDGSIIKGNSGAKPAGPYVVGCAASNGVFTPSSLDVAQP